MYNITDIVPDFKGFPKRKDFVGCFFLTQRRSAVEELLSNNRIAIISLIVEDSSSVPSINELFHQYSSFIIGRMGLPCPNRGLNLISVAMDAPQDKISALSGKLGALKGVNAKALYAKTGDKNDG